MTAQVTVAFTINCKSVAVPELVQPNSEQACLLGLNAIPLFGIKLVDSGGKIIFPETTNICVNENRDENVSNENASEVVTIVNLVGSVTIPAEKCWVVKVRVEPLLSNESLFEPNHRY